MYQRKITHLTLIKQQLQIQDGYHSMTLFDIGKMNTREKDVFVVVTILSFCPVHDLSPDDFLT
jgi:hypothetical protein